MAAGAFLVFVTDERLICDWLWELAPGFCVDIRSGRLRDKAEQTNAEVEVGELVPV